MNPTVFQKIEELSTAAYGGEPLSAIQENSSNGSISNPVENVKQKTSRAIDADYMAAVDRVDMETAQRMVDEAAKEAGYNKKQMVCNCTFHLLRIILQKH